MIERHEHERINQQQREIYKIGNGNRCTSDTELDKNNNNIRISATIIAISKEYFIHKLSGVNEGKKCIKFYTWNQLYEGSVQGFQ